MDSILEKYSNSVLKMLDHENIGRIVEFLKNKNCGCIDDIFHDYLDIFTIEYDEFVEKFNLLNKKYDNKFLVIKNIELVFYVF